MLKRNLVQTADILDWVKWVTNRIKEIGDPDYKPVMRYDVYGCIGKAFNNDLDKVGEYLVKVAEAASLTMSSLKCLSI